MQKLVSSLVDIIIKENAFQEKFLKKSLTELTENEYAEFEEYIFFFISQGDSIESIAKAYLTFVTDTFIELTYFIKSGHYRYSTFDEVAGSVYHNSEYMRKYMIGLGISTYLWPNHRNIYRWFQKNIPQNKQGKYLEIGPGHGKYYIYSIMNTNFDFYEAVDISASSVEMTRKLAEFFIKDTKKNYSVIEKDFFVIEEEKQYDAVIMGEVLEHVEQPLSFMKKIHNITSDDAYIYITTAINAPAVDHIYHFKTVDEVYDMMKQAGFKVISSFYESSNGKPLEKAIKNKECINIALILEKVMVK